MTLGLAVYGSCIATAVLVLQLVSEWRSWSTRVEVTVKPVSILSAGQSEGEPVILFTLINHSGHPVKVTHLSLEPIVKGGQHLFLAQPFPEGVPGPFEIPPRDSITKWQPVDTVAAGDPSHKTRATVATSDGKLFKSKRVRVRDLLEKGAASDVASGARS
jgi:hypothetical protein